MGGRKLSDERQILNLSESANELTRLVESGLFRMDKPTSDKLNGMIAEGEALEAFQQFYYDGNKRTGRYMMNGNLMSHGIDAISVPAARKQGTGSGRAKPLRR